jgi:hypothetical protein
MFGIERMVLVGGRVLPDTLISAIVQYYWNKFCEPKNSYHQILCACPSKIIHQLKTYISKWKESKLEWPEIGYIHSYCLSAQVPPAMVGENSVPVVNMFGNMACLHLIFPYSLRIYVRSGHFLLPIEGLTGKHSNWRKLGKSFGKSVLPAVIKNTSIMEWAGPQFFCNPENSSVASSFILHLSSLPKWNTFKKHPSIKDWLEVLYWSVWTQTRGARTASPMDLKALQVLLCSTPSLLYQLVQSKDVLSINLNHRLLLNGCERYYIGPPTSPRELFSTIVVFNTTESANENVIIGHLIMDTHIVLSFEWVYSQLNLYITTNDPKNIVKLRDLLSSLDFTYQKDQCMNVSNTTAWTCCHKYETYPKIHLLQNILEHTAPKSVPVQF